MCVPVTAFDLFVAGAEGCQYIRISSFLERDPGNELVQGNPRLLGKNDMCFGKQIFARGELLNYLLVRGVYGLNVKYTAKLTPFRVTGYLVCSLKEFKTECQHQSTYGFWSWLMFLYCNNGGT